MTEVDQLYIGIYNKFKNEMFSRVGFSIGKHFSAFAVTGHIDSEQIKLVLKRVLFKFRSSVD